MDIETDIELKNQKIFKKAVKQDKTNKKLDEIEEQFKRDVH